MARLITGLLILIAVAVPAYSDDDMPTSKPAAGARKAPLAEWNAWRRSYEYGVRLHSAGKLKEAAETYESALRDARRLFPKEDFPGGRRELADNLASLASALESLGDYARAESFARESLDEVVRLHPQRDQPAVAEASNRLGYILQARAKFVEAEDAFRAALAVYERHHAGQEHEDVARETLNVAYVVKAQGRYAEAEPLYRKCLEMLRRLFPDQDHRGLAISLSHMAGLQQALGQGGEAEQLYRDALAMQRRLHAKRDHPEVAQELNNVATCLYRRGKHTEAAALFRESIAMCERLYPDRDVPLAAHCLRNLGRLHQAEARLADAESSYQAALGMLRRLYPEGHPDVALAIQDLAGVRQALGKLAEAESLARDALALQRQLHPSMTHPEAVASLLTLASVLMDRGQYTEAESHLEDALALQRRLYADNDHPDVGLSLQFLSSLQMSRGQHRKAEKLLARALLLKRSQIEDFTRVRQEGDTLTLLAGMPLLLDAYISNARHLQSEPSAVYCEVWINKGLASRAFEARQLAARAASEPKAAEILAQMMGSRRRRADLLLAPLPSDQATRKKRDSDLDRLTRDIERLDRDLRPLLPTIDRATDLASSTPADLQAALPAGAVVVDFLRYDFFEQDPERPGVEGRKRTFHYLAFVIAKNKVSWVDLGPAAPIEDAVTAWLDGIRLQKELPPELSAKVRELVWANVRKEFPDHVKAVYISPDRALCRVPWAALPGDGPKSILLEDYAVAVIPHAMFLLDKLSPQQAKSKRVSGALVLGGVAYDSDEPILEDSTSRRRELPLEPAQTLRWKLLPWTEAEARGVANAAVRRKISSEILRGREATVPAVLAALPKARYAHLATHGFFAAPSFRSAFQLDPQLFAMSARGERIGGGALSPLVMTGLVFAGANHPQTTGRGVATGEALIDLDLSGLELAVLSACETGLGDVAGGEGTFGLQRAFHLAGTRNVVASLWSVSDQGTSALMAAFYRNLWDDSQSPMEALRQAQLEIYRHPDKIAELAKGLRGKFEVVQSSSDEQEMPKPGSDGKAHPRYWAAFVLSGPGR
jgi:CHAT domain-containing protein/Tfp pilus assembly protein PilF